MSDPIRTLTPPNPDSDAATFDSAAYQFTQDLLGWTQDVNAVAIALTLVATNDTSTTSNAIGMGSKTFTVSTGKSFQPGMYVVIADSSAPATNSMLAQVSSYNSATGALVVNVISFSGSGTKTAWTISQSTLLSPLVADNEVTLTTGNGHGSTNTKIRRYTTTQRSVGSALTYTDSATAGASITINEPGLYQIYMQDEFSTVNPFYYGFSVNSAELTTNIQSITAGNRLGVMYNPGGPGVSVPFSRTVRLAAGDVIRPHTNGSPNSTSAAFSVFSIRKVGV